jgi:hypothetical protein
MILENSMDEIITQEKIEQTATQSRKLLDEKGWCAWTCRLLRGDTIILVSDDFDRLVELPTLGYPVYLLSEMDKIESLPDHTCRLIHFIKKHDGGATVMWVRKTTESEKAGYKKMVQQRG